MLKIKVHRLLWPLRKSWKELEHQSTEDTSVYQSYFINRIAKQRLLAYILQQRYFPQYIEVIENGKTRLIVPVCKYWAENNYCSLGKFNGFQVYDVICAQNTTKDDFFRYFSAILNKLQPGNLTFHNVPKNSLLYCCVRDDLFKELGYICTASENENVCIHTNGQYDVWYNNLSKSTRQNIRTAYNRMKADDIHMSYEIFHGQRLTRKQLDRVIDLYCSRHAMRYDVQTSPVKKLYLKYFDFSTTCLQKHKDNFSAIVYMNGEIAAFMAGLVEKKGSSVIIPRLSISDSFSRYSPGVVLINETIKVLTEEKNIGNLDLSKGAEGYKKAMGGDVYCTFNIDFKRK